MFYLQTEVCSGSLTEIIQGVVAGADGCVFTYGYSKLGKLSRSLTEIIQGVVAGADGCIHLRILASSVSCSRSLIRNNSGCGSRCRWLYSPTDNPSSASCFGSLTEIIQDVVAGADGCVHLRILASSVSCSRSLSEIIQDVVAGADGCIHLRILQAW